MSFFVLLLAFLSIGNQPASGDENYADNPVPHVKLSVEKKEYYLGEPINFTITFFNNQDIPTKAFFNVSPGMIMFQHKGGSWACARYETRRIQIMLRNCASPVEVPPRSKMSFKGKLFFFGKPVLSEPGEYEIKVNFSDKQNIGLTYESDVVTILAKSPPDKERAALAELNDRVLGSFLEGDYRIDWGQDGICSRINDIRELESGAEKALTFLEQYPDSIYSPIVRDLFRQVMEEAKKDGGQKFTPELNTLYGVMQSLQSRK
jgi:hypothetical protein